MSAPCVVIGGGFAGLAAATRLAEQGATVHLVEARPTLGGRANAFRDPLTGERVDNGQHVLAGCYHDTLAFLRRIGTHHLLHRPSTLRLAIIDGGGHRSDLVLPALPAPWNLVAGILAWDALPLADRLAILRAGRVLNGRAPIDPADTVRAFLVRHRQTPRLCEMFWEPLALAALNQSIDQAAAPAFVEVVRRLFGPTPEGALLLLPAVPLADLYAAPARTYIERAGGTVTTGARARVVLDGSRVAAVASGARLWHTDTVICAVPWFALRDVLADAPPALARIVACADAIASLPIVTVNLWIDGWSPDVPMLGLPGRTFQWIFDRRQLVAGQRHLSLVSSGAERVCRLANDALVDLALHELRAALPPARRASLRHASVIRERRATFSLAPGLPPRPGVHTPIPGLYLAGDWIDTGLPATIESAVLSGHRAAAAVLHRR